MPARRVPSLALPVDSRAGVSFRGYQNRTPLLTIATGRPALMVTLTLPEQLEAGHVDFARQLAAMAWAYAVAVERRYRGLPPLPDRAGPARAVGQPGHLDRQPPTPGPGAGARAAGGDRMTATASVRFGGDGKADVQSYVRLTDSTHIQCSTYDDAAPILTIHDGQVDIVITNPGRGEVTEDDVTFGRAAGRGGDPVRGRAGAAAPPGTVPRRLTRMTSGAGGVMTAQMKAGRLELVPPAAPGFSPETQKR